MDNSERYTSPCSSWRNLNIPEAQGQRQTHWKSAALLREVIGRQKLHHALEQLLSVGGEASNHQPCGPGC